MKTLPKLISFLFLSVLTVSCSSSSEDEPVTPEEDNSTPTTFINLSAGKYWDYEVKNVTASGTTINSDHLYVNGSMTANAINYTKMNTTNAPWGSFSGSLNNNGLRIDGTRLKLTGLVSYAVPSFPQAFEFNVTDFVLFKQNAASGTELSNVPGSFSQTVNNYPLTFTYSLRSVADGSLASFTSPHGETYQDVKKTKVILRLKITVLDPTFGPVTLLNENDVITSTQHYANGIGMVYNNTSVAYQLNFDPIPSGIQIPISLNQTQEEFLTGHN